MNRPTWLEYALTLVGCYALVAAVFVVPWAVSSWLRRRKLRAPVRMLAPLPVATLHLATAYRRDPLRVRR